MLKNYLKVAFRNIKKNKLYAGLNILGLSVGLGTFFIIYLFVSHELSYDQFHSKGDRIHRVILTQNNGYGKVKNGTLTSALAPVAKASIPEIEAFSRIVTESVEINIKAKRDSLDQTSILMVDEGFFQLFDLVFIAGNGFNALQPNSIVISESRAMRYFNSTNVLGESISISGKDLLITGVFKDWPLTTSIKGDLIAPLTVVSGGVKYLNQWGTNNGNQTYFLLQPKIDLSVFEQKINEIYGQNRGVAKRKEESLSLQVLSYVHFSFDVVDRAVESKTDRQYIYIFSVVGIFILLCAIFNYISLTLSQSIERTKEIGVRKVVGAPKRELFKQFLVESVLNVIVSFIFAIVFVEFLLPKLEYLVGREIGTSILTQPVLLFWGLLFSLVIALLCSIYPSYISTKLRISNMLKGGARSFSSARVIGAISVIQVVVFITLICVAFTANRQMHFMRNEKLGYDKDQVLVIDNLSRNAVLKAELLTDELSKTAGVSAVSQAYNLPGFENNNKSGYRDLNFMITSFYGDSKYFEVMGMTLLEGRPFGPEDSDVSDLIVINHTLSQNLGLEGSVIGQTIDFGYGPRRIIGVVNDFHSASKKVPVEAMTFYPIMRTKYLVVRLEGKDLINTVARIKESYKDVVDDEEASVFFLEDQIDALYAQETIMITVINAFVILAAIIAVIGLFGISGYTVKRRLKEMGIRKVLGASFLNIQYILNSSSFWKLLVAIGFAVPLVVLWMQEWLSSFAYRIEMPYFLIVGAIALSVVIVFMAISFHSIRAYFINPVEILKDE